ncbi:MAG TPA: M14 family metallopeptidase [Solirubrobacteraceae bacterium]|nr:M14 family metallopeptidase [Solirubrobacteraceae bacterium]
MTLLRFVLLMLVSSMLFISGTAGAAPPRSPLEDPEPVRTVTLRVDGSETLDQLADAGVDLSSGATRVPTGLEVEAVVSDAEAAALEADGVQVLPKSAGFEWGFRRTRAFAAPFQPMTHEKTVRIARADWFTTKGQGFLYVEARTTEGAQESPVVTMELENDRGEGTEFGDARAMSRFVDSGEYMFHRNLYKLDERPSQIRVESSTGGEAIGPVSDWLQDVEPLTADPGYQWDFVDDYKHPQQLYSRFEEIARQYPNIARIVRLPNRTNGYQRKAQATLGSTAPQAVVVSSAAWGHQGGNDVTVELVQRSGSNRPLEVEVDGKAVRVLLAKGASGELASTVADVAAALRTQSGGLIDRAHAYRGYDGTGIVQPTLAPVPLTDFLNQKRSGAPAGEVPRGPYTIRALRITRNPSARKPGVLIQAQDHAREWVPATITLETAERLVRNYRTDPVTRSIVNNTDIFLIPSNNPDGANYSFYNFASQRKSMTNHCPDPQADPGLRNSWGVDLNRNYRVGSGFDGYSGASTSCTSGNYQGPAKLSEPESKNAIWLAERFPNIKFFMSVHSNGGQLFWQPGAYIAEGRITTPRPPLRDEAYYWQSAERILSQVRAHRQTVVTPENVGGSSDVLYSSAGNVREDLYHNYGIYAFGWEVGGSVYNPATGNFQEGSFQPPWVGIPDLVSGHSETMEYANGVMEMFRIAEEWGKDRRRPTSELVPGHGTYPGPVDVVFETSEPASVYYTTNGSLPTVNSPRYKATEFREPGETFHVTETTTFKWFSVDTAGNVERGYDPDKPATRGKFRQATITIED